MNLRLPRPDLFIAAVGRSGSTILANLLTSPPSRWVIIEPRFIDVSTGRDTLRQATEFGWGLTEEDWSARPSEEPFERLNRIFAAQLARLDKWGFEGGPTGSAPAYDDQLTSEEGDCARPKPPRCGNELGRNSRTRRPEFI